jgi:hypothetical protein
MRAVDELDDAKAFVDILEQGAIARLAFMQCLEPRPCFVLPSPRPQCCACDADQRGRVERAFDKGDIAQNIEEAPCRGIALQPAAAARQQDERKVGPVLLFAKPGNQGRKIGGDKVFLCHDDKGCADIQLFDERGQGRAGLGANAGFLKNRRRDRCVPASRRENERPLG